MGDMAQKIISASIKDYWEPAAKDILKDYRHPCGEAYNVHFLDRDGMIVRKDEDGEWRCVLVAICEKCAFDEATSDKKLLSYNYLPIKSPNLLEHLQEQGVRLFNEFGAHLKAVQNGTVDLDKAYSGS